MFKSQLAVSAHGEIARGVFQLVLRGEMAAHINAPGQFVYIRCGDGWETLLRRPISIADWDKREETMTLIYRVTGKGTAWLSRKRAGEVVDVLGPLGNGFHLPSAEKHRVLLVGGGVGVPPLYGLARELKAQGKNVQTYLGFASAPDVFLVDQFRALSAVKVTTDDGTYGFRGRVTDLMDQPFMWDVFYACGPYPMLKALQQLFAGSGVEGYLSLEQRMGCGIGACLACVCPTTDGKLKKICSDGPVFPYEEVAL